MNTTHKDIKMHSVQQLIKKGVLIRNQDGSFYPKVGCTLVLNEDDENPVAIKSLDVIYFPIRHLNIVDENDNQFIGGDPSTENIKIL